MRSRRMPLVLACLVFPAIIFAGSADALTVTSAAPAESRRAARSRSASVASPLPLRDRLQRLHEAGPSGQHRPRCTASCPAPRRGPEAPGLGRHRPLRRRPSRSRRAAEREVRGKWHDLMDDVRQARAHWSPTLGPRSVSELAGSRSCSLGGSTSIQLTRGPRSSYDGPAAWPWPRSPHQIAFGEIAFGAPKIRCHFRCHFGGRFRDSRRLSWIRPETARCWKGRGIR